MIFKNLFDMLFRSDTVLWNLYSLYQTSVSLTHDTVLTLSGYLYLFISLRSASGLDEKNQSHSIFVLFSDVMTVWVISFMSVWKKNMISNSDEKWLCFFIHFISFQMLFSFFAAWCMLSWNYDILTLQMIFLLCLLTFNAFWSYSLCLHIIWTCWTHFSISDVHHEHACSTVSLIISIMFSMRHSINFVR